MEKMRQILRSFSELRDQYPSIETAIEMVCVSTKLDLEEVLKMLTMVGVYVLPDSKEENEIKCFIRSADMTKTTVPELMWNVGFYFCISDKEAARLVDKWLDRSDQRRSPKSEG